MKLNHFLIVKLQHLVIFSHIYKQFLHIYKRFLLTRLFIDQILDLRQKYWLNNFLNLEFLCPVMKILLKNVYLRIKVLLKMTQIRVCLLYDKVKQVNPLNDYVLVPAIHVDSNHDNQCK
jgi:hypothetical protein